MCAFVLRLLAAYSLFADDFILCYKRDLGRNRWLKNFRFTTLIDIDNLNPKSAHTGLTTAHGLVSLKQ